MAYANKTKLEVLITSINDSVSTGLENLALEVADTWATMKMGNKPVVTPTPDMVEKAATYYAYVFILRNLYDTDDVESVTMTWYENAANKLMEAYSADSGDEESPDCPFSSSLTPTQKFIKRNLRTVEDKLEYDEDFIEDTAWDSE